VSGPRIPLGRAWACAQSFISLAGNHLTELAPVGSLRRFDSTVGDISLLAVTSEPAAVFGKLSELPGVKLVHQAPSSCTVQFDRQPITVHTALPDHAGAALLHYTGSRGHTIKLIHRAEARDLELGPTGIRARKSGKTLPTPTEADVYRLLDLPFIAPELREGHGEVEAAEAGTLPQLVERRDIRGDLHMHSTWSDGRDDIEGMVKQAVALGYEYIAITDHSQHSVAAGGLTPDRLRRQRQEIDQIRPRFPEIAILHGAEVDIMPDGELDFTDSVLAELDIVLASLHEQAWHTGAQLTDRYLSAIQNPFVNIITHPTNRLVGYRSGYDLDFPRLFAAAVETGTALEIDGAPAHLDMEGTVARRAIQAGVTVSIDSDCHRAAWLDGHMALGIGTARRGWVESRHVLNTRSLKEVQELFSTKKRKGLQERARRNVREAGRK
jgi:DNA polymerase (family 10)